MFIANVFVRFFRSFNYDYLRKTHEQAKPHPWDKVGDDELFYPFVAVSLEKDITTVVGANESGKSQLLSAIEMALSGEDIQRGHFCRYSQFFAVNAGTMALPDFGLEFRDLTAADRAGLEAACKISKLDQLQSFAVFRFNGGEPVVYLQIADSWTDHQVRDPQALAKLLPHTFRIESAVPLPDSVPLAYLAAGKWTRGVRGREERKAIMEVLEQNSESWFGSAETLTASATSVINAIKPAPRPEDLRKRLKLADDLLVKIADVDRSAFQELLGAVREDAEGFANGIVKQINQALAASLNFPKWWSQDLHFELLVTLRDQDLVFTIRDRTGTEYSASERSGGLRYFLSYFVQYLSHEAPADGRREVLLMDEPDAFLSSMGQQDLLRIFEDFASPADPDRRSVQVVYVTHSPFLIDKNHGDRIRVLEKGEGDEGTRVVNNAARNHYEPLRSAFGSFVGETTFISNCNLMVEGMSDQILLAGMAARLQRLGTARTQNLDLNTITLVPAGSASHIPYLVYLARGRDVDRPAVIVLLDSDTAGDVARRGLERGGPNNKQLLKPAFILQVGNVDGTVASSPHGVREIEDLVPAEIGLAALRRYVADFVGSESASKVAGLQPADLVFVADKGLHHSLENAAQAVLDEGFHLDKVGLSRAVADVIRDSGRPGSESQQVMDANFRALFFELSARQRRASREMATEKTSSKIKRVRGGFLQDHPHGATREQVTVMLEEIEAHIEESPYTEQLKADLRAIRFRFELLADPGSPVADFDGLCEALGALTYVEERESQSPARAG